MRVGHVQRSYSAPTCSPGRLRCLAKGIPAFPDAPGPTSGCSYPACAAATPQQPFFQCKGCHLPLQPSQTPQTVTVIHYRRIPAPISCPGPPVRSPQTPHSPKSGKKPNSLCLGGDREALAEPIRPESMGGTGPPPYLRDLQLPRSCTFQGPDSKACIPISRFR